MMYALLLYPLLVCKHCEYIIHVCADFCHLHDIKLNAKHSDCLFRKPTINKRCGLLLYMFTSDSICKLLSDVNYLEDMKNSTLKTTLDVKR